MGRRQVERYAILTIVIVTLLFSLHPSVKADSITGSGNINSYYFNDSAQKGYLNLTNGQTWTMSVTNINASQITGDRIFQFFIQDYGAGWEMVTIQAHINYYGLGGHLFQSYDKGWVLKSSQTFYAGSVPGKFDLRIQIKDIGTNYQVTPQYRLPDGNWLTFQGGCWNSATYELTQAYLAMQIDAGSDGTVTYDTPTVHSEDIWHVDKTGKIQDAITDAPAGKTVIVFGGTHLESLYINKSLTLTGVDDPIVKGSGLNSIDYGGTQLTRDAVIFVANSTNIVLQGLDIQGANLGPESNVGAFFIFSGGRISNCTISPDTAGDMNAAGIEARATSLQISQCFIKNFGKTGIYFGNCTAEVCNTTINGNVYTDPNEASRGIEVDVYRQGPSNIEITGNEIQNCDNTYSPEPLTPSFGIGVDLWRRYDDLPGSTVNVQHNRIHDNYEGLEFVPTNSLHVNYNEIYNNTHGVIADQDYFETNPMLDARFDWWGDSSGPLCSSNLNGNGDTISDRVDYSPWLQDSLEITHRTYCVNPTGTIQEAIDAADSNETILVSNGIYDEQLLITRNLTIQGTAASAIIRPSSQIKLENILEAPWQKSTRRIAAIVAVNVTGASYVAIKNLGIDGCNVTSVSSQADFVVGILYLETSGEMDTLNVTNIMQQDSNYGSGVYVACESTPTTVEIRYSTITNFRRNGIESCGGCFNNLNLYVDNNYINGRGPIGAGDAVQNGILITEGSSATVTNNFVANLTYTSTSDVASGILFFEANGAALENTATNCQTGIAATAESSGAWNISLENNRIDGSSFSAVHTHVSNMNASIILIISNNNLTGGSGEGINIGLPPDRLPAGKVTFSISANLVTGWTCGVHLISSVGDNSTIGGNTIMQSTDSGILVDRSLNASKIIVTYNSITQNENFGVFNNGSGIMDARYNWWGDSTGPYHQTLNPLGQGDKVSDNVTFIPWLTEQQGLPIISIQPQSCLFTVGETRDVILEITNATSVTGWELKLFYRNDVVDCTDVTEGPFLQVEGSTFLIKQINNYYNSTHGRLLLACSLLGQNVSVRGSGTLATITFTALAHGETPLNMVDTKLSDERIPPQPIPHNTVGGDIQVGTIIEITPASSQVTTGQVFSINVAIEGAANLTGWEFKLFYKNNVLNCTGVVEGPFLNSEGSTFFMKQINNAYNATHGRLLVACSLLGQDLSVNGNGITATIFFQAIGSGTTDLDLADTKLSDEKIPPQPIQHFDLDGAVSVSGPHDLAVINASTSKTGCKPIPSIGKGYAATINVTVRNNGDNPENFSLTVYANSTVTGTTTVINLYSGAQIIVTFTWNTSSFELGNYTISAYAEPVPGETHVGDNTFTDGTLLVTIAGDINGDFNVDIYDAILLSGVFNLHSGDTRWCPNADIDCNDTVDIYDAIILASHFGAHAPG
jgi:hypothetical protein